MRHLIQIIIIAFMLLIGVVLFVKYFPSIWGDIVYPLEYQEHIISASEEFDVDRNLIAAVIFVESRFDAKAGSHAGAKGLMQLMPPTARGVARQIGMTGYQDSQIYDPRVNIRLGTAYLRSSIDSRKGNLDVALANYNAGPRYAGRFEINLDRSVLPRETDNYIRKVKSAKAAYDEIYGENWQGADTPISLNSDIAVPLSSEKEQSFIDKIQLSNLINILLR